MRVYIHIFVPFVEAPREANLDEVVYRYIYVCVCEPTPIVVAYKREFFSLKKRRGAVDLLVVGGEVLSRIVDATSGSCWRSEFNA